MVPLGTLNIRCRIIIGIQKGTIILTTTHIGIMEKGNGSYYLGFRVYFDVKRASCVGSYPARAHMRRETGGVV